MIIALAGRRIDPSDAQIARFPLEKSAIVRERIHRLLLEQQATSLVVSASCGADLLALDVAGDLGIRRSIILPFEPAHFRETSVIDRPGDWGGLFDRIISEVSTAGDLFSLKGEKRGEAIYRLTNQKLLEKAQELALVSDAPAESVLAVIVWNGEARGPGDITLDFANEARKRLIPLVEVPTR